MPWNLIFGGITGLIGSITTSITNYKIQKLKNEHEIAVIGAKTSAMQAQADASIKIANAKVKGEIEVAEQKTFETSIVIGNKNLFSTKWVDKLFETQGWMRFLSIPVGIIVAFLFGLVDALKAFTRPGTTWLFVGATIWLAYVCMDILATGGVTSIGIAQALAILTQILDMILYLTATCVSWWFGDRRVGKFLNRLNDGNAKNISPVVGNTPGGNPF